MAQALPLLTQKTVINFFERSQSRTRERLSRDTNFTPYLSFLDACAESGMIAPPESNARIALFKRGGIDCLVLYHLETLSKKKALPPIPSGVVEEAIKRISNLEEVAKGVDLQRETDYYLKTFVRGVYSRLKDKIEDPNRARIMKDLFQQTYEVGVYLGRGVLADAYAQLPVKVTT